MYGPYKPLRYWVQKVLPLVYDNSLSYYELLNKIVIKLNEIGALQNELIDRFDENLERTVSEVLNEWLDTGKISGYLNNLVIVNDYGAKGDGETDDTEAIQRCVDENPNSTILFKIGTYIISDSIELYGNQGGQTLILGGATLKWAGGVASNKFMIDVNKNTGTNESRCIIIGGNFNGADLVGGGLRAAEYFTTFDGCRVFDITNEGITIGYNYSEDTSQVRSLQCVVKNCFVSLTTNSGQGWSDNNNIKAFALYEGDSVITGCNSNRTNKGVFWKSGGNTVKGSHFTAQYRTPLSDVAETYGIYLEPYGQTTINAELVESCYFDNHKYCIYAATPTRKTFSVTGCKYFWSGKQANGIVDCFISGGYFVNMNVTAFDIVPVGGKCRFYDASFVRELSYQAQSMLRQDFTPNIYSLTDEAFIPYTANHLCNDRETQSVYREQAITDNDYIMVGCLLFNESTEHKDRTPSARFKLYNRTYGDQEFVIHWNANGEPILMQKTIYTPSANLHFILGQMQALNINGNNWQYVPFYLHGVNSAATNYGLIDMFVETGANANIYLINEKTVIRTNITPALDIDLSEERSVFYYPIRYKTAGATLKLCTDNAELNVTGSEGRIALAPAESYDSLLVLGRSANGLERMYLGRNKDWVDGGNIATLHGRSLNNGETFYGCIPDRSNCAMIVIMRAATGLLLRLYADTSSNNLMGDSVPDNIVIVKDAKKITITNNTGDAINLIGIAPA